MAITLTQARELSDSKLTTSVIDEFRKSALLDRIPFDNCVKPQGGKTMAYVYNRISTLPSADVRAIKRRIHPAGSGYHAAHRQPEGVRRLVPD